MSNNAVEVFRNQWKSYEKLIEFNHLRHAEVLTAFKTIFSTVQHDRIADLGCGNCWLIYKIVQEGGAPNLKDLVGVDLSETALAVAAEDAPSILPSTTRTQFIHQDIKEFCETFTGQPFPVIMTSLCLHHFIKPQDKADMLNGIVNCLQPGGTFIWCDVYNSVPGRDRSDTMQVWHDRFKREWVQIPEEEFNTMWSHVNAHDHPETLDLMEELMIKAGLEGIRRVYVEDAGDQGQGLITVMCATKPIDQ